ncbi:MAG: hypothetical protein WCI27_01170 [Candidatus Omnitrophota bacterium]
MNKIKIPFVPSGERAWLAGGTALVLLKLFCLCFFSSDFQNRFFIPFVSHFLASGDDPWQFFFNHPALGVEFPYSPAMLYILSFFYFPAYHFGWDSVVAQNFFFKLPLFLMDISILFLLLRLSFDRARVIIFYFAAPVIWYATYVHSQLDIIPTGLLFWSIYALLRGRTLASALFYGVAIATKMHVLVALPIMLVYLWRGKSMAEALKFLIFSAAIPLAAVLPFRSEGFVALVLHNPQQAMIYDAFIRIGDGKLYLTVLCLALVWGRFISFPRVNKDILYAFLALIFAALVAFLIPGPGWYVWLFPFISIFFIKAVPECRSLSMLFWWFNFIYLVCVVFFYDRGLKDIVFLQMPLNLKVAAPVLKNITATFLSSTLIACMYIFYKLGIKSNFFYKHDGSTVIAIAGDSASGKTTLMHDLKRLFGRKMLLLEGDADHKWERQDKMWEQVTHLNPRANDLYGQYDDLLNLKYGRAVRRRDYDHKTGKFLEHRRVVACDYIALSGLHAFYLPKMRKIADVKVFLDTDDALRTSWKVTRDSSERGYAPAAVKDQMSAREQDARKYIIPQRAFSDIVIGYAMEGSSLQLKAAFDSNIRANVLVDFLKTKIDLQWDYSEDLKTQVIVMKGDVSAGDIQALARDLVLNMDDLIGVGDVWESGYRGIVQLLILLVISETVKAATGRSVREI